MQRIHYWDNLRALAMLAGVVFHASLAYAPSVREYWPAADTRSQASWIDAVVWFPHLFRMPLFFVTAGYFAALLVKKRGLGGMLKNRAARVLLPLVLLAPPLVGSMSWLTRYAAARVQHPSPVLQFLRQHEPTLPPTLSHFWFLAYLMWFYLLVWIAHVSEFSFRGPLTPVRVAIAGPLVLILPLFSVTSPFPAPEFVLPQLWALVFFGVYFAFGYWLFDHPDFGATSQAISLWIGAVIGYCALCWLWSLRSTSVWIHLAQAVLESYTGAWMTLTCLHLARRSLNRTNRLLRYGAQVSYWTYIIHLPVLLAIQYLLLDLDAAWPWKFFLSVAGTLAFALLTHEVLVKRTPIGAMLHGRQSRDN